MDLGLTGKVVLVGGASRGLGYAVAQAVAAEGAKVSIMARDSAAVRDAAARLTAATGADVIGHSVDVTRPDQLERWVRDTAGHWGGIDACLSNAGGPPHGEFPEFDDQAWRRAFDLIVLSAVRLARAVIPHFQRRGGGALVFVTSSSTKEPIPGLALSTVTRASVAALSKDLSRQYAAQGIRVNHLVPGRIDTSRVRSLDAANAGRAGITPEEQHGRSVATIPLGRYGEPAEFGRVGAYLLSPAASYITGATLQVDGGMLRGIL
ncbi:MAG: SDR family oxidoreductase [Gemmatimonadales bacterium]